jgi:MFS family permease
VVLSVAMTVPPLVMAALVGGGLLNYPALIAWALVGGAFGAFAQPARDALLNRVAGPDIQRVVTMAVGVQFGIQIVGFALGAAADRVGPAPLMLTQAVFMLAAAAAVYRVPALTPAPARVRRSALAEIGEGLTMAWQVAEIRAAIVMTFSVGVFFAGAYLVLLPLMVRDLYQGSAAGIAGAFAANMLGTCTTILVLMRRGGVQRPGRALMIGGSVSVCILALLHAELSMPMFYGGVSVGAVRWHQHDHDPVHRAGSVARVPSRADHVGVLARHDGWHAHRLAAARLVRRRVRRAAGGAGAGLRHGPGAGRAARRFGPVVGGAARVAGGPRLSDQPDWPASRPPRPSGTLAVLPR